MDERFLRQSPRSAPGGGHLVAGELDGELGAGADAAVDGDLAADRLDVGSAGSD